jgi:hypothetical protein
MHLAEYMSMTFPGLDLGPTLFYKWPIGIRFELGTNQAGMSYEEVVLHRASTLYEEAFCPSDVSWIVSGTTRYAFDRRSAIAATGGRYRTFCPTIFQLRKPRSPGLGGPAGRYRVVRDEDEHTREITTLRWASIRPRSIDYRYILQAKANDDYHLRRPQTCDRIYFVNRTRNLILHMYDDRGMDLVAAKRSDLQTIYDGRKAWVLDYDRARIQRVFEAATN